MHVGQHPDDACRSVRASLDLSPFLVWGLRGVVVAFVCFHAYTLAQRQPFLDEAWFIARAKGFSEHGYPFGALDVGVFDRLPGYQWFFPYFPTAIQAVPFLFSDEPSLYATRLISLCCGLVLVSCMYILGRWVSGSVTGLLAAALTLSAPFFEISGGMARIDSEAAAVGFIGLTLVLTNARRSWIRFVMGGFLAGIAVEFHAHAAAITAPALAAALTLGSSIRERSVSFLLTALGCALSGVLYAVLHVLPNPAGYLNFQLIAFAPTHTPPLLAFDLFLMVRGVLDACRSMIDIEFFGPLLVLLLCVGGFALTEGRVRTISTLAVLATLSSGLLIRHKFRYYWVYFHPLTLLLVAALVTYLVRARNTGSFRRRMGARLLLGCVVSLSVGIPLGRVAAFGSVLRDGWPSNPLPDLSTLVRPDDRILGSQTFWLSLPDSRYYSPEHLIYYTRWKKGASVSDALRELSPTLVIEDEHLRFLIGARQAGCPYVCFPDDGLERFIASSELVTEIRNEKYGDIRLYRPRMTP